MIGVLELSSATGGVKSHICECQGKFAEEICSFKFQYFFSLSELEGLKGSADSPCWKNRISIISDSIVAFPECFDRNIPQRFSEKQIQLYFRRI